jgi:hypothetical protein
MTGYSCQAMVLVDFLMSRVSANSAVPPDIRSPQHRISKARL